MSTTTTRRIDVLETVTVLTDAEIKASPTTPPIIVPAVSGHRLVYLYAEMLTDFSLGAYGNIASPVAHLSLRIDDGVAPFIVTSSIADDSSLVMLDATGTAQGTPEASITSIFGTAAKSFITFGDTFHPDTMYDSFWWSLSSNWYGNYDALRGAPLKFKFVNGAAGNLTGGNAANTATIRVVYLFRNP